MSVEPKYWVFEVLISLNFLGVDNLRKAFLDMPNIDVEELKNLKEYKNSLPSNGMYFCHYLSLLTKI